MHSLFVTSLLLAAPALEPVSPSHSLSATTDDRATTVEVPGAQPGGLLPEGALIAEQLREAGRALVVDDVGGGVLWAAGPTWKASFGADGFTYVPFLGSDAPRNYPVRFTLERVTVGGEPLELERAPSASRTASRAITLDRGGLREVYYLNEDSVEQTFVFDAAPRSGELVLRLAIDSDLAVAADGPGFTFACDRGGVRYGSATGIAATGARFALQQRLVDGALEIRVPASELGPESFPFVVDPIVTTMSVTADSRDQVDVDVAFDATSGVYMIVYEEVQSTVDHDVRSVFFNSSLGLLLNPASIDITADKWIEPRVANSYDDSLFLCVATRGVTIGSRDVWGRTRNAGNGAVGAQFAITALPGDNARADVGGLGGSYSSVFPFFVVWQNYLPLTDDYDVYGQAVTDSSTLQGAVQPIADSPTDDDMRPRISRSSGRQGVPSGDQEYLIAWEREVAAGDRDLWTRVVSYTGSTTGHAPWRSYSFGDSLNVDVSSQSTSYPGSTGEAAYVLAFERLRNGAYEIFTVVTREGNPDNARSVTEMQDLALGLEHADPRIANDGTGDFMIAYKSEASGGGFDAHVTTVNIVWDSGELRTGVAERRLSLPHASGQAGAVAIATTYDGGEASIDSLAMTLFTAPGAGGDDEVSAALVTEVSGDVDGSQFCHANDNASGLSAWIRGSESGGLPGSILNIRVQDLPQNAFGYVLASLDAGLTTNAGGGAGNLCLSGSIGRFNGQVMNSGATGAVFVALDLSHVPQPSGHVSVMAGERWNFQYWTRDTQSGMATSNFSNAIAIDFN